jgi:hypothetical protein
MNALRLEAMPGGIDCFGPHVAYGGTGTLPDAGSYAGYFYSRRISVTVSDVRFTWLALKPAAAMAFPKEFRTEYQYGR